MTTARTHLHLWEIPQPATCSILNIAENVTILVRGAGSFKSVLRIHRPGYQSPAAIRSELAWIRALRAEGIVRTPAILPGCNGHDLQSMRRSGSAACLCMVMFKHCTGHHPDETGDLTTLFSMLGALAARLHDHASRWHPPTDFIRPHWNIKRILDRGGVWGDWRLAPNMTPDLRRVLNQAEQSVRTRLDRYGMQADRYGLIHADMRLANIIMHGDTSTLIDFDDCGFGWFLADFAAAVSFIESRPDLNALWHAWSQGYQKIRPLPPDHATITPALVMMRRLALLAWVGSRSGSSEPKKLAPHFSARSAEIATRYLNGTLFQQHLKQPRH